MWAVLLRGGRPCFRHRASLSCGWAILVPRNALLLGADSCHLCRWWQASGASLAGWRGLPSLPHPPGLWQAQQEERGACGIGGWRAGSSASPGSSFCPTEASCSGRDKGPFLIVEQTTEQAFSAGGEAGLPRDSVGLMVTYLLLPFALPPTPRLLGLDSSRNW